MTPAETLPSPAQIAQTATGCRRSARRTRFGGVLRYTCLRHNWQVWTDAGCPVLLDVTADIEKALSASRHGAVAELVERWPTQTRDMVSRGQVRSWLSQQAELLAVQPPA